MLWGVSVQRLGEHLRCCPASPHRRWPYDCSPVIQNEIRSLSPASSPGQGPSCSTCFTGYLSFNHPDGILQMLENSQLHLSFSTWGCFSPSPPPSPPWCHTLWQPSLTGTVLLLVKTTQSSSFCTIHLFLYEPTFWNQKLLKKEAIPPKKDTSNSRES